MLKKRGEEIWAHRKLFRKNIKGSDRYEVLKRAKYRCELCGSPEKHRALEVDHIIPKSIGGPDGISNYQSFMLPINTLKGNKDDTDFRKFHVILTMTETILAYFAIYQKKNS